jgi:glucose/arabinose dehydrogenase
MKATSGRPRVFSVESLESRQLLSTVPAGFVDESVVTGLNLPTAAQFLPDGRLLIAEQGGTLRVVKDGTLLPTPALSLTVDSQGERGLIGVTADPDFATNHFIYVYHTLPSAPIHNQVSRFTLTGDVADPSSEVDLLDLDNLSTATNHNGGSLHFGTDDKLYVAVGENALGANAQSLNNRLGKILRINPDGSIPADNPFFNTAAGANRAIWAYGLRNPFEFAVQPGTGRILINDVGQSSFEEVDEGIAGSNYGWPVTEGTTSDPRFVSPIYTYDHSDGSSAITGGTFYNPSNPTFPNSYVGNYFFADLTGNYIKRLTFPNGNASPTVSPFATDTGTIVDLDVGPTDGSLYYLRIGEGDLRRIRATTTASAPTIDSAPQPQKVATGHPATFSVQASGTAPLTYQWQRNGQNIPGATSPTYTLPAATLKDSGATFRVVVTNAAGSVTSTAAKLTVGKPPVVTVTAPATFDAGKTLLLTARATDANGTPIPAKRFRWSVELRDAGTVKTVIPSKKGTPTLTLTVPARQRSTTAFYRVTLTVTDSLGITKTVTRKIRPHLVKLTLRPSVPGPTITLDNQPVKKKTLAVAGSRHALAVSTPAPTGGITYHFLQWSDGPRKPRRPLIISPQGNLLTAEFRAIGISLRSLSNG